MKPQIQSCLRALLAALSVLLLTGVAVAAGRLQWTQTTIQEREDQAWKVEVAIFLPKAPDVPYVPMKFEFQQVTYFARDRVDGDTPEGKVGVRTDHLQIAAAHAELPWGAQRMQAVGAGEGPLPRRAGGDRGRRAGR